MKKTFMTIIVACAVITGASSAFAATATVEKSVNFRTEPSTSSSIISLIPGGAPINVTETVNSYWVKATYNGKTGYVSANYVDYTAPAPQPAPTPVPTQSGSQKADLIIAYGKTFMGTKYVYGGDYNLDGTYGFDCSGFMHYIFAKYGVNITRQSATSASNDGYAVSYSNLRKGDLVYFYSPIHHIGVYIGDGKILHTYGAGGVRIDSIAPGSYWYNHLTKAKRVL